MTDQTETLAEIDRNDLCDEFMPDAHKTTKLEREMELLDHLEQSKKFTFFDKS